MRFQAQTFWLAKDADEPDQYQDAFELDAERGLAAVADGVSSAIFSGPWARILTRAVVAEPPPLEDSEAFQDWLARQRECWSSQIDISRLTWYQRPKMVDGAMTTLLWVEFTPLELGEDGLAKSYRLRSFAIGDSCLFYVRSGETLTMFPLTHSEQFGLNPAVVGSIDRKQDYLLEFQAWETACLPGDLIVLCTDAIALWACQEAEAGRPVNWEEYCGRSDESWREEIDWHRQQSQMRFDDSTLVLLRVIEETPAPIPLPSETPLEEDVAADAVLADELEFADEESDEALAEPMAEDLVEPSDLSEDVEAPLELMEEPKTEDVAQASEDLSDAPAETEPGDELIEPPEYNREG